MFVSISPIMLPSFRNVMWRRTLTTNVEPPRFCVQCVNYVSDPLGPVYAQCLAFPQISDMDDRDATLYRVAGVLPRDAKFHYCTVARRFETLCGPIGRHYVRTADSSHQKPTAHIDRQS